MKLWKIGFVVCLLMLIASVSTLTTFWQRVSSELDITQNDLSITQDKLDAIGKQVDLLEDTLSKRNEELDELKDCNDDMRKELGEKTEQLRQSELVAENLTTELNDLLEFYYDIFRGKAPPYRKPDGTTMNLIDYESASDVTWDKLVNFMESDQTDKRRWIYGDYVCSNFAEDLHNNAEKQGIRCAVVIIHFRDTDYSHAINAFNTIDRGLVFIDNTGLDGSETHSWDSVAYIRMGKTYGLIKLGEDIESFEYEYYEEMYKRLESKINEYNAIIGNYNMEVEALNRAYGDLSNEYDRFNEECKDYLDALELYNLSPTPEEYNRLVAWHSSLMAWGASLESQWASLNERSQYLESLLDILYKEYTAVMDLQLDKYGYGIKNELISVEMYW